MASFEGRILENFVGPKYQLKDRIGGGGFSQVYDARVLDPADSRRLSAGKRVTVKIFDSDVLTRDQLQQIYQNESSNLTRLDQKSPFIANILDHFEDEEINRPCIVTEYIDGASLKDEIENMAKLPVDARVKEALRIAWQVATGMRVCQENRITHGDLNPSNVVLRGLKKDAVLIDFGFSRSLAPAGGEPAKVPLPPLGTFRYAAPEQYEEQTRFDSRMDMYGFGCTLFEMLTGRPPFPDFCGDQNRSRQAALKAPRPTLGAACPELSDKNPAVYALNLLIHRCMQPDCKDRYERWAEITATLDEIGRELARLLTDNVSLKQAPSTSLMPYVVSLVCLLIVAGIAYGVYKWPTNHEIPPPPTTVAAEAPTFPPTKTPTPPTPPPDYAINVVISGTEPFPAPLLWLRLYDKADMILATKTIAESSRFSSFLVHNLDSYELRVFADASSTVPLATAQADTRFFGSATAYISLPTPTPTPVPPPVPYVVVGQLLREPVRTATGGLEFPNDASGPIQEIPKLKTYVVSGRLLERKDKSFPETVDLKRNGVKIDTATVLKNGTFAFAPVPRGQYTIDAGDSWMSKFVEPGKEDVSDIRILPRDDGPTPSQPPPNVLTRQFSRKSVARNEIITVTLTLTVPTLPRIGKAKVNEKLPRDWHFEGTLDSRDSRANITELQGNDESLRSWEVANELGPLGGETTIPYSCRAPSSYTGAGSDQIFEGTVELYRRDDGFLVDTKEPPERSSVRIDPFLLPKSPIVSASITRELSATRVAPGETISVTLTLAFTRPVERAEVVEIMPTDWNFVDSEPAPLQPVGDRTYTWVWEHPETAKTITYRCTAPLAAGQYEFTGELKERYRDASGAEQVCTANERTPAEVIRIEARLRSLYNVLRGCEGDARLTGRRFLERLAPFRDNITSPESNHQTVLGYVDTAPDSRVQVSGVRLSETERLVTFNLTLGPNTLPCQWSVRSVGRMDR